MAERWRRGLVSVKRIWQSVYGALFALSLLGGAGVFGKADLSKANADWYAVGVCLVLSLMFPSLMLWQAHSNKMTPVQTPSFERGIAGGWRRDPLQWLRISCLLCWGSFVGRLLVLHGESGKQPFMATCVIGSFAIGFAVGELVCRRLFAALIVVHRRS
jgi:hypothetical protein